MFTPLVRPLPAEWTPQFVLTKIGSLPYPCLLHSSQAHPTLGRFSYLGVDPYDVFRLEKPVVDPLAGLAQRLTSIPAQTSIADLPPFQGGAMGMLSYDLGRCFERVNAAAHDEFGYPLILIGFYDVVFVWDHVLEKGWLVSQGLPAVNPDDRSARAAKRADDLMAAVSSGAKTVQKTVHGASNGKFAPTPHGTAHGLTAPQFDTRLSREWIGSFDSTGLQTAVSAVREYIAAGDVFQVNIAQRLIRLAACSSIELYLALSQQSPAPFAGYFDGGDFQIVSSSPERFLKVDRERWVETRPIKGTRPRGKTDAQDELLYRELYGSEKDRAENTMIVDLLRNDLSRVCESNSIEVPQLCEVEKYPQVHHLVSVIRGRLRAGVDVTDLLAATFPGGSITGAPKVRAMEIIAELEPTSRGPYCGSLGYISLDGSSDWNILIRTIMAKDGWWQFNVGGGIVYDSVPQQEEEETWTKAKGMVAAIDQITSN